MLEGKRVAVVVGVNEYQDKKLKMLEGSKNDAYELSQILSQYGNFKTTILTGTEATHDRIRAAFYDILWQTTTYDLVFIYFSGHGIVDNYGEVYLTTYDINIDRPMIGGIPIKELNDIVSRSVNKESIVIILDSSFSGIGTKIQRSREGLYMMAASSENQIAREGIFTHSNLINNTSAHPHGVFSYHLIEGMAGAASDVNGLITFGSLYNYVNKKMSVSNANQKPVVLATGSMEVVQIAVSPSKHTKSTEVSTSNLITDSDNEKSISETRQVQGGPSPYIMTDNWTVDDALGYRGYAYAIARFITHRKTSRPLCISIQAPWGRGKTSLMRMIQGELDEAAVKEFPKESTSTQLKRKLNQHQVKLEDIIDKPEDLWEEPLQKEFKSLNIQGHVKPCVTIWFNAWAYENSEQIWSGLADSIVQQIAERLQDAKESTRFLLRLHIRRRGADTIARRIYDRISRYSRQKARPWELGSIIGFAASATIAVVQSLKDTSAFPSVGVGGIAASAGIGVVMTFLQRYSAKSDVKNEPVQESLGEFVDVPDYRNRSGFMLHVVEDIQSVIESIPEDYLPMVIFIDDLDRCSPNKVVNIVEAINLFLGGSYFSNCVFVIGMDTEMVAAALETSYSKVIGKLQDYSTHAGIGWRFMDKFVQLPFVIPPSERSDIDNYVKMLFSRGDLQTTNNKSLKALAEVYATNKTKEDGRTEDVPIEQTVKVIATKYGLNNEGEKAIVQNELKEKKSIQGLSKMIEDYDEEDPEIRKLISDAAIELPTNPRDIKRFMNVFRFQYFLLLARRSRGLSTPSNGQLTRWIVLSMKWPDLTRWLQTAQRSDSSTKNTLESGNPTTPTGHRLLLLEDLGRTSKDYDEWLLRSKSQLGMKPLMVPWLNDEGVRSFFNREGNMNPEERLSTSAGKGLY